MNDNHFTFSTVGQHIHIHQFSQHESRGDSCLLMLQAVIGEVWEKVSGSTGWVSYLDHPPESNFVYKADLRFCTTKVLGERSPFLPFPCPHALRWPQIGLNDSDQLLRSLILHDDPVQSDLIFWLGADTHPSRARLAALSLDHPEIIDAELMSWDRSSSSLHKSRSRHVTLWDHRHFKYVIDCPGYGYSGRLKWLLASGRPVFVIDRKLVEHWHDKLMPWVHFIPVRDDLTDLIEAHRKVESNFALYQSIARAARRFAQDYLTLDSQLARLVREISDSDLAGKKLDGYEFLVDRVIRPAALLDLPGIFLEVGAFEGERTRLLSNFLLSEYSEKPILVIDPFQSQSEESTDRREQGEFNREKFERNVKDCLNVKVFRGLIDELDLSPFAVSFAILDSGKTDDFLKGEFLLIWRRLVPGGVIVLQSHGECRPRLANDLRRYLEDFAGQIHKVESFEEKGILAITKM